MVADPGGKGPFRVAYDIQDVLGTDRIGQPGEKTDDKKERCPKTKHIRDEATGWKTSEKEVPDPDNPGKTKTVYVVPHSAVFPK